MAKMTKSEKYLAIAKAQSGVLFIQGKPAEAKSAIVKKIATDNGYHFTDLRLSQMDETDIGLFPHVNKEDNCVEHLPPRWAVDANKRPTLIFFDELNRAKLDVRNAALQILLDRSIGYNFEFNGDVLMMSAGNFGDEDGCEVEEMDNALWNRLITVKHELSIDEWRSEFADEHVWEGICKYVHANPSEFHKEPSENSKAYATPRSWTFLSDFLKSEFGGLDNIKHSEAIPLLRECAHYYIGAATSKFLRYLDSVEALNINDILDRYDQVELEISKLNRTRVVELLEECKVLTIAKIKGKRLKNLIAFLGKIDKDELSSFLFHLIDSHMDDKGDLDSKSCTELMKAFDEEVQVLQGKYK